jgi:hypothetical protein
MTLMMLFLLRARNKLCVLEVCMRSYKATSTWISFDCLGQPNNIGSDHATFHICKSKAYSEARDPCSSADDKQAVFFLLPMIGMAGH